MKYVNVIQLKSISLIWGLGRSGYADQLKVSWRKVGEKKEISWIKFNSNFLNWNLYIGLWYNGYYLGLQNRRIWVRILEDLPKYYILRDRVMVTCRTHNLVIWVRIPVPPPLCQGGVKVTHKPHKFMFWVQVPALRPLK